MNCKVILIDFLDDGHHVSYAKLLIKELRKIGCEILLVGTSPLVDAISDDVSLNGTKYFKIRKWQFSGIFNEFKKGCAFLNSLRAIRSFHPDIVHFLQLDRFMLGICSILPLLKKVKVVSTLHWYNILKTPCSSMKSRVNILLFKHILKSSRIITHSTSILNIVNGPNSHNLFYAPYPIPFKTLDKGSFLILRNKARNNLGISDNEKLLLCFGGTRYDKGVDIAIRSLPFLDDSYRLLIAGKEEAFSYSMLASLANHLGVTHRILYIMAFIEDEMVTGLFTASDYVLIPYRSTFLGQSGPLVLAASLGIPVIGSSAMIIQETIEEYKLGVTFKAEDPEALAQAIRICPSGFLNSHRFFLDHNAENFCRRVLEAYGYV